MSAESDISPFTLFPLSENSTVRARNWLQSYTASPDMLTTEKEKFKNRDEELYVYIDKLSTLRKMVQFDHDEKKVNAYWNGALYMLTALRVQYDALFKDLPIPSQDTMRTHFFNLLDIENNHGAVEELAPYIFDDPNNDFVATIIEFLEGYRSENFDTMAEIFGRNSEHAVDELLETTPHLETTLVKSSIEQTHGPAQGLVYGAYDMFEIFRIHEEGAMWEERFQKPTH